MIFFAFFRMTRPQLGKTSCANKIDEELKKMMKQLWLYPLIFGLMIALILFCAVHIAYALYEHSQPQIYANAQLVWKEAYHAEV